MSQINGNSGMERILMRQKKIGSTTNLMENATLVVKRSYVFRTVI